MSDFVRDIPTEALPCQAARADGEGLKTIRLIPDGQVQSTKGVFTVDAEGAALIVEKFNRQGNELVIDFEHQTLGGDYAAPDGRAPAAGWVTKIWYSAGLGLLGLVRWNPKTSDAIREGAYAYLSPVVLIRKSDGKAIGLHSAALTNKPAILKMERLAASQNAGTVDPSPADENATIVASVRTALGLAADAGKDAITLALSLRTGEGAARAELAVMKQADAERIAQERVEKLIGSNVLNPNIPGLREAAVRLFVEQPQTAELILSNAKPLIPPGRTTPPSSRQLLIGRAEAEYKSNPGHSRATSLKAFVQQSLRDSGLAPLSEDEARTLVVL